MTDKESGTAQADPEVAELAASIIGEEVPAVIEGKDSVSPQAKTTSDGKDVKPEDGKAPASEGKTGTEGEGDGKPEEGGGKGEQEDPLKDLAGDAGALKTLLGHSTLGPILNKWADDAAKAQVTAALTQQKPITEAETRQAEAVRVEDEHFSSMTQEQISEEIAGDEVAAVAYAKYQERKQTAGQPNAGAIAESSQIYSYASRVAVVSDLIKGSDLSAEIKESLKSENFTHRQDGTATGAEGIKEWESAVFKALVTHEASAIAVKEIAAKKETLEEEVMAEVDGERPAIVSGRAEGPTPDLIKTDSSVLLERALSQKPKKGN
jgi:hypothetical protein